jgi:hypothetical protein
VGFIRSARLICFGKVPIQVLYQQWNKEERNMPIDINSPLWAVLADWIKVILTLPDPPPDPLTQLNDVAILTAISALTERLSPAAGAELRKALPSIQARLKAA